MIYGVKLTTVLLSLLSIFNNLAADQNVTVSYNPGCNIPSCFNDSMPVQLIYAKLQDEKTSVHYVISTIDFSCPTILLLKSNYSNSKLLFVWDKILSNANDSYRQGGIKLVDENGKIYQTNPEVAIYLFSEILGYSDTSNTVDINNPKSILKVFLPLNHLTWNVSHTHNSAIFNGTSHNLPDFSKFTWLAFKFQFYGSRGRDAVLPRLGFDEGSSKLEVIMNNFTANFSNPRYSLFVQASNPLNASFMNNASLSKLGYIDKFSSSSIDDEYAPSVFTSSQIKWKNHHSHQEQSHFWLWRTVCYTQPVHTRKFSTDVKSSKLHVMSYANSTESPSINRLLLSYFGKSNADSLLFNSTLISFGNADDKFYSATHYIGWTSLIGLGAPPGDSFSLMVICVLTVGLGLPCLVIFGGVLYMFVRRRRGGNSPVVNRSSYEAIA